MAEQARRKSTQAAKEPVGADSSRLRPVISSFDATMIVAGSMIGSGIFIVSADIARRVHSPALLLMVWVASGVMTVSGALACGELAAMMPSAGGQYVYLRETYGRAVGFLYGWTLFAVIQTGTIAAVAVAFARFASLVFSNLFSKPILFGQGAATVEPILAIGAIGALTAINLRGVTSGKTVQNALTVIKAASLVGIIAATLVLHPNPIALRANFGSLKAFLGYHDSIARLLPEFGAAMVGGLFSADAWAAAAFAASEFRSPERDLPRALVHGTTIVIVLYVLVNLGYLAELPIRTSPQLAGTAGPGIAEVAGDRVAAAALATVWGSAGALIASAMVMVSTLGCANGLILTGARALYAMAQDGLFFASTRQLNRAGVPGKALAIQGLWAAILAVTGSYSELLDYVIFAQLLFYALTVGAVFLLRWRRPDVHRPYRAWGYPLLPAAYIVAAALLMIDLLAVKPAFAGLGLLIVLSGLPVYWVREMVMRQRSQHESA